MSPKQALDLPDKVLDDLYSGWSEDTYCASWIGGGEEEFVQWILSDDITRQSLAPFKMKSIKTIRELLMERIG